MGERQIDTDPQKAADGAAGGSRPAGCRRGRRELLQGEAQITHIVSSVCRLVSSLLPFPLPRSPPRVAHHWSFIGGDPHALAVFGPPRPSKPPPPLRVGWPMAGARG
jgi:hypothetical protein